MLLYHYSEIFFSELKTLEQQRQITEQEKQKASGYKVNFPDAYYRHISFLLEKAPIKDVSSYFNDEHKFWPAGKTLYEYQVDSSKLAQFKYVIVETPEATELLYDKTLSDKQYEKLITAVYRKYTGVGSAQLEKQSKQFIGKSKEFFKLIKSRENFEKLKTLYAPTVPHVFIYPKTPITYQSVKKVIVGKNGYHDVDKIINW